MERALYKELVEWKRQKGRLPLVVRGARQVGKSYLIEQFGKNEFDHLHVINFEKKPELKSCFDSLDPKDILKELELQTGKKIEPNALLFFDEIQDCPKALKSLRYFAEEMPQQPVISAGSLLEFVLEDKEFSFPVGRVQFVNLRPLSFLEYLNANGEFSLVELIKTVSTKEEISEGVHKRLLKFVQEFLTIGGMPGIVKTYKDTNSYIEVKRRQAAILDLYALDFGKYATKHAEHRTLKKLFEKAPSLAGMHFKYSKIDPESANPARDYKEALNRLRQARLLLSVHKTKGNELPLRAEMSEKKFKIFLLDVGLLVHGLGWESLNIKDSSDIFRGVVAEQFVAQELIAIQDPYIEKGLYYWENSERSSSAELDFLVNINQQIVPIEVKSGSTGRLKSLRQFLDKKKVAIGVRISERPLDLHDGILSVPFYLMSELPRLLKS